jgi:prepilin-type N-terminal cleavage/methylation domain-containing protein
MCLACFRRGNVDPAWHRRVMAKQRGFTLLELLVALAVLGEAAVIGQRDIELMLGAGIVFKAAGQLATFELLYSPNAITMDVVAPKILPLGTPKNSSS